jgi:hypothetical protein
LSGSKDEQAISQLATIRYYYNARGQLLIESKEDARKRGIKSPDRAEAMMLAYAGRQGSGFYELTRQRYEESQTAATQTDDDDDPAARAEAAMVNLVKAHSTGHFIEIDPHYYKGYIRPRLRASADPAAAVLATELDRRFGV